MSNFESWQGVENEITTEAKKDRDRNNYFRCKQCGQRFHHSECILDKVKGYQCPNGCIADDFEQPPYESPFN